MNNSLAPTYQYSFGENWVLWYAISNSYSIVERPFKLLLDAYFESKTIDSFKAKLLDEDDNSNTEIIENTISNYLQNCNVPLIHKNKDITSVIDTSKCLILKQYSIKGKSIQIYFDSELVLNTIHPSLAHLSTELSSNPQATFVIYLKNEQLHLFKDEQLICSVPKRDYHHIQGKFIMQLICCIHDKKETDWIGTFHGSTITDSKSSIIFVGKSGKGKSTLCALLAANGFDLLADDVSPMLSYNKCIFHNPSAISIKEGSFSTLKSIISDFNDAPIVKFNKSKGSIKYIPFPYPVENYYPCNAIVLVNYKKETDTSLKIVSIKTALETLIPDSWLSPNPLHAKQFLDWLETVSTYELTYSNTESAISEVSKLFKLKN